MKKTIRMNERELHRLINESVTRLLNEWDGIVTSGDFDDPYEFSIYCNNNIDNDDSDEEDDNRIFNREEDIITKKVTEGSLNSLTVYIVIAWELIEKVMTNGDMTNLDLIAKVCIKLATIKTI